ncbi:glycosyltransferase family 2 protein [Crassisporium funariophilum]|nr:glycosyltransferase family 2 protein [Crassisporium funariophilum]
MSAHQRLEAATDLSRLSPVFMTDTIYTGIGTAGLVALNPHKYVSSNADSILHKYASEYRDSSEHKERLPPHIFQLANNAYYHMRRTTQDQCLVFSGETGSGKSENRRLAIKTLLELSVSNPGKKGSKLATQVPASEFVLETFGNARTLFNPNASRFGKYTELQFSDRGRLSGVKTLDYYLERNRVAAVPSGERNFHIFYYLVAGASPEERQHLHLLDKTTYRYLGQRGTTTARPNGGRDDDGLRFDQLKIALKTIGFSKRHVAQTCQLVAAILHLGNLEFSIDRHRNEDAAVVRNTDLLEIVSDFLGIQPAALELVKKELCTVFLDPDGASDNRDDLAKTLYSLLFAWLNEHINQRLCKDDFSTFIGLFDLPGPQNMSSPNSLDQFCINFANERLQNWMQKSLFEKHVNEYNLEGVSRFVPQVPYFDNTECIRLLQTTPGGLIHIMDDQARRQPKKTDHTMVEAFTKRWGNHSSFKTGTVDRSGYPTFTVNHFNGGVTYSSEGFLDRDAINPDFVSLLRGAVDGLEGSGSINPFVKGLFSAKAIATQAHPRNEDTIVAAQQAVKPMRAPSTRRKSALKRMPTLKETGDIEEKDRDDDDNHGASATLNGASPCVAGEFKSALDTLFETVSETQPWYIFCINPNDSQLPNQLEGRSIARRSVCVFEVGMTPEEFCDRYREGLTAGGVSEGDEREVIEQARSTFGLGFLANTKYVFLTQNAFHKFEDQLRSRDVEEQKRDRLRDAEAEAGLDPRGLTDPYAPYRSPNEELDVSPWGASGSYGDPFSNSNQALPLVSNSAPFQRADLYDDYDENKSVQSEDFDARSRFTSQRDDSVSHFGSESYAPSRNMFQNTDKRGLMEKEALAGEIQEGETTEVLKESSARRRWMKRMDVRQAWREKLALNLLIWFICGCAIFVIAVLGVVICPTEHVFNSAELASHSFALSPNNVYTSIRGEVFDLTNIAATHQRVVGVVPNKSILKYGGQSADSIFPVQVSALCNGVTEYHDVNAQYHDFRVFTNDSRPDWYFERMVEMRYTSRVGFVGFTPKEIRNLANTGHSVAIYNGLVYDVTTSVAIRSSDITQAPADAAATKDFMDGNVLDLFKFNAGQDITKRLNSLRIDRNVLASQKVCLRNLFTIGKCLFATYILLVLSVIMVAIIGFKFLASINFGGARDNSLRRTIDSLAQMKYDDKRKLLVVICDGMIVGSGNDHPNLDPEPLSFMSLGEGAKQHNMGKVYSGLYECSGHVVPYLVIVKVGKPTERSRPGNRGKRDSQMLMMHFLNKVHFNAPMNPLELEMYHQIKNVIGNMIHDKKLLGSLITMMQVYEYFHMAKAFESLFGSVTCLPGCFTLYRLRTHKPLLISNQMVLDYSENRVDTLHTKNLLHLGEDRYLTTLLLKHFPLFKTQFIRDAHAFTVAPDDWRVLLSQRRRWINSCPYLGELIFLEQLCGFCCFSMRFVVMIDLLSTITQPVTVAYIVYLVWLVAGEGKSIPTLSLIMIAAIYGVQALVFIMRRKWDMIGWMIFYIIAIPAFSFFLPLYSFWKMDDFSWGQTRLVMGESGKKMIVHDEGKFDPRSIPLKSWSDYENELWDKESNHSIGSWVPPTKAKNEGYAESRTASLYGRETYYEPRGFSPAPSQLGMHAPPGYNSGRNTPQSPFNPMAETALLQPTPSRPITNYLDIPIPRTRSPDDGDLLGSGPSNVDIDRAVQDVLRSADLNSVTKREIRRQLEDHFGMDLTTRKAAINAAIDRALLNQN